MTTKNALQLKDESTYPDKSVLTSVLGESLEVYEELLGLFEKNNLDHEWRYYKDGGAWLCKVQKKKKIIVWMSIWKEFIQAVIYLPLRLLDEILDLDIQDDLKTKITETKNVGKSKPCIFEIRDKSLLSDFEKVILFKLKSK
ncbi:DUF3788 family protein [Aureitalea sp. L0-47]|uniref:DUF3788 domain-containing protein n=1 Tax=Aureitalea sp. L0-47 TaxID=2816962 RepID=UPI00223785C5|nr:DUF3788 domain-containing protein [Aureitalea sp. L0-47]MCW5518783.1 DUF3788 family protein [Aureitalea sp. L0-47]